MNENAKSWLIALRSRLFKQAKGALREEDAYCCLGVACELAVQAGVIPPAVHMERYFGDPREFYFYGDGQTQTKNYLPPKVMKWLGIKSETGSFNGGRNCLASENDQGATFDEIAALIEKHQEELFEQARQGRTDS